jgi:predicted DNA-binding transcriptional regulator AlpA
MAKSSESSPLSKRSESRDGTRDRLIDEREAAVALGLSCKTLQRWRWACRGPTWHKIGGAVRYRESDLTAFRDAGRHEASDAA